MPTAQSQTTIDELNKLINAACDNGDNVSAIALRANVSRSIISQLRNGTCPNSPSVDTVSAILSVLGKELSIVDKR